ncbi:MAG: rod shape-determining protein MreD [Lachnospiraceae bacterium]|nr:rod shape-determining protein MreD [Lachnospiraceae bacterium]
MRKIAITVMLVVFFLLQAQWQELFPSSLITPNFLLMFTVFCGFLSGCNYGTVVGFISGLFLDVYMGQVLGFHSLTFVCIGYFCGYLHEFFYEKNILFPLLFVGVSDFLYNFIFYIFYFLLNGKLDLPYYMLNVILPEMLATVCTALISFHIFYFVHSRISAFEKRGEDID